MADTRNTNRRLTDISIAEHLTKDAMSELYTKEELIDLLYPTWVSMAEKGLLDTSKITEHAAAKHLKAEVVELDGRDLKLSDGRYVEVKTVTAKLGALTTAQKMPLLMAKNSEQAIAAATLALPRRAYVKLSGAKAKSAFFLFTVRLLRDITTTNDLVHYLIPISKLCSNGQLVASVNFKYTASGDLDDSCIYHEYIIDSFADLEKGVERLDAPRVIADPALFDINDKVGVATAPLPQNIRSQSAIQRNRKRQWTKVDLDLISDSPVDLH